MHHFDAIEFVTYSSIKAIFRMTKRMILRKVMISSTCLLALTLRVRNARSSAVDSRKYVAENFRRFE